MLRYRRNELVQETCQPAEPEVLDPGPWIQDQPGFKIKDPESRILDPESMIQDSGAKILDPGSRILDPRSRILGSEVAASDSGTWL